VFDVWSNFAYFRRHYTTTTASTHPFIPRSAAEGLVGAICGYSSEEFPDSLGDARIAISLIKINEQGVDRVAKLPFGVSYTHSDFWTLQVGKYLRKGRGSLNHVPVPRTIELIIDPAYRIYFSTEQSHVYSKFVDNLKRHRTHYTPYLGSSNMIANFAYVGEYEFSMKQADQEVRIQSILPFIAKMPYVKPEPNSRYAIEQNIPLHLTPNRKATSYYSAVYSPLFEQTILMSGISYAELDSRKGANIVFIPTAPSTP